jgi:curved DNA-binding protein CbpA
MDEDLYAILGVTPEAGAKEIRSAHRALAKRYHPDTGEGSSDERFRQIQRAYHVLGDEERRAAYDRGRTAPGPRIVWVPSPASPSFARRHPHAAHLDLRNLSRRPTAERIDLGRGRTSDTVETDAWDDLIAFLFGNLP